MWEPRLTTLWVSTACYRDSFILSRTVRGSIPDEVIGFFNLPNPSSRTMALGSTQPLIFLRGKERPVRKADNLTAIYEPIV
jgi:hypothetical protein